MSADNGIYIAHFPDGYRVTPDNGIDYVVKCDYVEAQGDWLVFSEFVGEYADANQGVVHSCSSRFTKRVDVIKKNDKSD